MFYHVKWYRKPLLRDEGGLFVWVSVLEQLRPKRAKAFNVRFGVLPYINILNRLRANLL